jgi:tetratricopeptide (TPR) repeat protein
MDGLVVQILGWAQRWGGMLKEALAGFLPDAARPYLDAAPELLVLLGGVFVGLVVLRLVLGLLFGRRGAKRAQVEEASPAAPPPPVARPSPLPPKLSRPDPRPGFEAATSRGENGLMLGDLNAARANFEEAERIARRWAGEDPGAESLRAFSRTLLRLSETHQRAGAVEPARRAAQEALGAIRSVAEGRSGDIQAQRELAVALERVGGSAAAMGDKASARRAWEEELSIAARLAAVEAHDLSWQRFLAVVHVLMGNLGEHDALSHYDRALRHFEVCAQAGGLSPADAETRAQLKAALRRV